MLYLKKVEMYGFKSFADKVELKFDQPITAIVGPNGCGKSNISDAIRWVLGEQSTKNLRGKLMQDLIFSGTDTRKSMSYCEVSLYMDNTTRIFPLPMDEVIISRKLYRNNESEYLLNRNVVRLMDIKELLRGVGLGKEGYSIVGQGRMDAILNAKPEDRRAIFEEALGISTFRVKKVETERKLEKTRLNTEKLMIIVEELKRRLPELKRQSTNAKKYLDLYGQLKHHEINAYIYSYDNASQQKADCRKKLDGLREEYAHKEILYAEVNEKYDDIFHKRNNIDTEIAALRDKQVALAVEVERNSGEKNLVRERINNLKREVENTEQQIVEASAEIDKLIAANDQLKTTIAHRIDERNHLENEILQITDKHSAIARRVDGIQKDLDTLRNKLEEVMSACANQTSALTGFEAEVKTLNERLVEIAEKERELSLRLQESAGEEGDLLGKYEELRKLKEELEKQAQQLKQQVKDLEYKQFNLNTELQRKQQAYSSAKGGIDMLKDFVSSYRGYSSCIQNLMQDAKHDSQLSSHICGVVANLIKVEPKLRVAIETALGGRLQNIVTKNEDDVKYIINYLKINDYGKATFLPVSSMKPHGIERADVLKEKGVLGIASELISYDKYYSNVFESLLGGIVIVDTFDNAVALSKKYRYVHRMVTLTGERISNDGSMEGGSSKKQATSLLAQEGQIEERTEKLADLLRELQTAEGQKCALDKQLDDARQAYDTLLAKINDVSIEIATCREKIETSNTLSGADKRNILGLSNDKEKISERLQDLERKIEKANAQIEELKSTEENLRDKIARMSETFSAEMTAKEGIQNSLAEKRYRLAVLTSNIDNLNREMASNDKQVLSLRETIEIKQNYISQM
ncbi:MAG: chromosome segregation protein SMC, partial [Clostridia bacterium]|nr:chromosome segregation protein SMC [Clostridia bacterium]